MVLDAQPLEKLLLSERALTWSANIVVGSWVLKNVIIPRIMPKRKSRKASSEEEGVKKPKKQGLITKEFVDDLKYLIRVCFPQKMCKEALMVYVFVTILISRSLLSLVTAEVDGYLVKQIVNRNKRDILVGLMLWIGIALPSSLINALIKYLQSLIALRLRQRLNSHIESMYFSRDAYYKLSHRLTGVADREGIEIPPSVEQAVTEGVTQWADRFADVISSLGKPMFDVTLFIGVLIKSLGWRNELTATIAVMESSRILLAFRPNFSQQIQEKNRLEAGFRSQYSRVVAHGEEIAFYGGAKRERGILADQFDKIYRFTRQTLSKQFVYGSVEEFLTKYVWAVIGILQVAVPLMQSRSSAGDNAKYLVWLRRILTRAADAGERLTLGVRDIGELSGCTRTLMNTIRVLKALNEGDESTSAHVQVSQDDIVRVENLPLTTPKGDILISNMNLTLSRTDRLLILGPNGCGKSTLFRVLCGLWAPVGGRIEKPKERTDMLFLPQRPYMIMGSLLEQIVYPSSLKEAEEKRLLLHPNSESLESLATELLQIVSLGHMIDTHGGLHVARDWGAVLSGGEKQRLGLTRVFFQLPKYAVLDECNSTLDLDSEAAIFERLTNLQGTAIVTVSHRHTLFKYHSKFLTYDGVGGYTFRDTSDSEAVSEMDKLSNEKVNLVTLIMGACKDLGENWPDAPSA